MRPLFIAIPIALVLLLSVSDAAAVDTPTTGRIVGLGGRCLDVGAGGVLMWDCHGGANQQWTLNADGTIENGGRCLDVPMGRATRGARLITWDCHGGDNQHFELMPDGTIRGPRDFCLDVQRGTSRVGLWGCHGGDNQQWSVEPL
jgi:hypothetical protein